MFSKISRYRNLPDLVAIDAKGRVLASKSLRLAPAVKGRFLHTIEEVDRLDHLAYKYYEQPRGWWRIADANPRFLSPLDLLGDGPVQTLQFPLAWDGPAPPWPDLLRALQARAGVENALMGTPEKACPQVLYREGPPAFVVSAPAVISPLQSLADFLRPGPPPGASLTEEALLAHLRSVLAGQGISLGGTVRLLSVEADRWRIREVATQRVFTFRLDADQALLNLYESAVRSAWVLTVTCNKGMVSTGEIRALIEDLGFSAARPVAVGRIGKSILIPPR